MSLGTGKVIGVSGEVMCRVEVTEAMVLDGFTEVPCFECEGTAKFELPDGELVKCGRCKGRRTELVMT